jgi:NAD(P)-dependent dehydrogenase (short-subunit alcohol dehydrogenase family)
MTAISARLARLSFPRFHRKLLLIGGLGYTFDAMDSASLAFIIAALDSAFAAPPKSMSRARCVCAARRFLIPTSPARRPGSYRAENIGLYGCSAGAGLSGAAVAWFQKHSLPRPGAIGMFGWAPVGLHVGDSNYIFTNGEPAFTRDFSEEGYASKADVADPLYSPVQDDSILKHFPPALDVGSVESIECCVAVAIERFRRIDILVNNAGIFQSRLGLDLRDDEFSHCMDINVTGMWRMVRALVPHFRAQGGGRIINIASVGGRRGVGFAPAYCASKAAVINLTQSLALALGADNINVNTVCPGAVATAMQDEIKAALTAQSGTSCGKLEVPLAGALTATDIGHAVAFFASDYARNITGQALNVDRGEVMS